MKTFSKWTAGLGSMALIAGTVCAQNFDSGQQGSSSSSGNSSYDQQSNSQQPSSQDYNNSQQYSSQSSGSQSSNDSSGNQQSWNQGGTRQRTQTGRFCDAKQLMGQEVNNQQGQTLGHIRDLAVNTQNGQLFAIIGIGNGQDALVPIQALNISGSPSNLDVSLNATKQDLENGPTVQNNQWLRALNRPGFTRRIYSHFNMQPNERVGVVIITPVQPGSATSSLGGTSSGSSDQEQSEGGTQE